VEVHECCVPDADPQPLMPCAFILHCLMSCDSSTCCCLNNTPCMPWVITPALWLQPLADLVPGQGGENDAGFTL
jgi:hypothetical protein